MLNQQRAESLTRSPAAHWLLPVFSLGLLACGDSFEPVPVPLPPQPPRLAFLTQPEHVVVGDSLSNGIIVAVIDSASQIVSTVSGEVALSLDSPVHSGTLSGVLSVRLRNGVAVFDDLFVDELGGDYRLRATALDTLSTTSEPFDVTLRFTLVEAMTGHTCGITTDGAAYCWGSNGAGKLGTGNTRSSTTPTPVFGTKDYQGRRRTVYRWREPLSFVAFTGSSHTCGLTAGGELYCWGANNFGQLGDGTLESRNKPTRVASDARFLSVSAASFNTCAVSTEGVPYCWGLTPFIERPAEDSSLGSVRTTPTPLKTDVALVSVSTEGDYACGLSEQGALFCWGFGNLREFGADFPDLCPEEYGGLCRYSPVPFPLFTDLTFIQISTRSSRACGLSPLGVALCWGVGVSFGLGDGTFINSANPHVVSGNRSYSEISSAKTGYACALTPEGTIYCWGQLVDSEPRQISNVPKRVVTSVQFTSISTGWGHACGVAIDGSAYCWGSNGGTIGDGTKDFRSEPTRVRAPRAIEEG